ncbi:MAG: hypothetical protein ACPLYX_09380 [Rectinema subterraneum]|uniref:hypothetical protein n=1 Tax=Rectinema subterraneum TaxID=2653714 RepID=UPI003C7D020F
MSQSSNSPKTPPSKTPAHVPEGASFLVRLDPLECAKKVLIPGHRFEPFHSYRISIPRLEIRLPDASPLPKKNIVLPYNEILRFHNLLNFMDIFYMLEEMYPGNFPADLAQASQGFDRLIRLSVFDLEPLFPGGIQQGSYVRLSVQRYQKGIFTAAPVTPEEVSRLDREAWFSAMDAAFARAFDELKFPRRNDTLLSLVYRYGGEALYVNPAAALVDYLDAKRAAEIIYFGGENLIWKKGVDPEHIVLSGLDAYGTGSRKPGKASPAARATSTPTSAAPARAENSAVPAKPRKGRKPSLKARLNRFFEAYEFAFNADEIKALMLDMVYRGTTLQDLWDRFFESSPQWTVFPEAADELIGLIEDYCDEALANYDPERDGFGEMRAALVDIYANYIAWMRRLDTKLRSPEDLPIEKFTELANLISSLNEFMLILNSQAKGGPGDPSEREVLEQFFDSVDYMRQAVTDLEHEIETIALRKKKGG